jgi:CheY-like chemotaxis protein
MLLSGKHIFITEDNPVNRVVFQMSLLRYGATVEFERWGRDALTRLRRESRVNLIILDLMLADGVSGYDIFHEIRALPAFGHVPILAVSAADTNEAIPRTRALGFDGFIAKPIDGDLFPKQVAAVIEGRQVWYNGTGEWDVPTPNPISSIE